MGERVRLDDDEHHGTKYETGVTPIDNQKISKPTDEDVSFAVEQSKKVPMKVIFARYFDEK
jgi:hypothetical protein